MVAALHGLILILYEIMEIHPHVESLYSHKLIAHWQLAILCPLQSFAADQLSRRLPCDFFTLNQLESVPKFIEPL